jgi:DNA-binding CsgD family transcriptional regulator
VEDLAVSLASRGDLGAAKAYLREAREAYGRLGAVWSARRASARLRPYGIRLSSRGVRSCATLGWDSLSPTEVTIARLVAEGRSNPSIAAELLLSPRTVQTHVSNMLIKLGCPTRVGIAREASRHA